MGRGIDSMHKEYGEDYSHRCRDCCNSRLYRCGKRIVRKCSAYGVTGSEATDWAGKWIACGLFGKAFEALRPRRRPLVEVIRARSREKDDSPLDGQIRLGE